MPTSKSKTYHPETRLVHAGTLRSQFNEMSEALFLTQGYIYPVSYTHLTLPTNREV